jgi:osmotically-inducible protein OsmY
MRDMLVSLSVFALALFMLSGCVAMTGKTAGENIDDASITTAVKAKLAGEKVATLTRIGVDTSLRTVYLTGVVENEDMRRRAAELAWQVGGVHGVVNNLKIQTSQ